MPSEPFSRPRSKQKLYGQHTANDKKPLAIKLSEWWRVAAIDTTISSILELMVSTLISRLDDISHPDEEIQNQLRDNVTRMQDIHGEDLHTQMTELFYSTLVSGYSVAENDLEYVDGKLLLRSLINYEPSTITLRPDDRGRLVENLKRRDGKLSGIYQSGTFLTSNTLQSETQLPMWKVTYLRSRGRFGNLYGNSCIEPIYRWHLLGDALIDIMADSMDGYAEPWILVTMAHEETDEVTQDSFTGRERNRTTQEIFREQFTRADGIGGKIITLPYLNAEAKPEVKVVSPPSNLGTMFIDTLDFVEQAKARGLLTPFVLVGDSRLSQGNAPVERRMEIYYQMINNLYKMLVRPFVAQTFHRLVRFNYSGRASSKIPPAIRANPNHRPEDKVALMQLVAGLTTNGYLNPLNEQDWQTVRSWVSSISREMTPEDKKYINSILLNPRNSGRAGSGTRKDDPLNRPRDRTNEGDIKGSGRPGRPVGTSAPVTQPKTKLAQVSLFDLPLASR